MAIFYIRDSRIANENACPLLACPDDAKRKALNALSSGDSGGSYGTNNDTSSLSQSSGHTQVIERIGGADGIRIHQVYENKAVLRAQLGLLSY